MNATGPAQPDAVRAKLLQGNEPGSANRDEPLDKIKEGFMDDYEDQDHPVVRLRKILASEGTDTIQVVKDIVVNVFSNGPWVFVKSSSDGWLGFPRHVLRFKNPKLQLGLKVTVNLDKRKTCSLFFDSGTLTVVHKSFSFDSEEELRYKLPEYYNMAFAEVNAQTTNEAVHAVSGPVNTDKTWGKDVVHTEKNYKTLTERTNLEESDLIQLVDELIYNLPYGPWEKTKQNKDFYHMIDQYTTNYKNPETNFSMKMKLLMKPLNRDYSTRYAQYTGTLFVFNPTGHMGSSHRFLFSADDMESVVYSAFNKAYEDSVKHEYHLGIEESVGRKTNYHKLKEFVDKMVSETLTQGQKCCLITRN